MKGHVQKRAKEWRRLDHVPAEQTGKPNLAGWNELAVKFGEMGYPVARGGERYVQA